MPRKNDSIKFACGVKKNTHSSRENHYTIYVSEKLIGEVSGETIHVSPISAIGLLSKISIRKLKERGLNITSLVSEEQEITKKYKNLRELSRQQKEKIDKEKYEEEANVKVFKKSNKNPS